MKKSFAIISILPLFLMACSSPTPVNPQSNSLPQTEVKSEVSPTPITTNSYVLAEPLAGKKLRISITAKDQDLYIINCNNYVGVTLVDKNNIQNNWSEVVTSCRSPEMIIPKGTALTFERQLHESFFPLNMNTTYQATVPIIYNPKFKKYQINNELSLSNPFKLIP